VVGLIRALARVVVCDVIHKAPMMTIWSSKTIHAILHCGCMLFKPPISKHPGHPVSLSRRPSCKASPAPARIHNGALLANAERSVISAAAASLAAPRVLRNRWRYSRPQAIYTSTKQNRFQAVAMSERITDRTHKSAAALRQGAQSSKSW
jgi:hypothetical protein